MNRIRWARRLAIAAVGGSLLLVGLVVPAGASDITQTTTIAPGENYVLQCPAGERFVVGTADYWRKQPPTKQNHLVGSLPFTSSDGITAIAGPAPKGSRFIVAQITCSL